MQPEGSKALSILLGCIGVLAMATSMAMNLRFGLTLAEDVFERHSPCCTSWPTRQPPASRWPPR
jgi:hypothetical protein